MPARPNSVKKIGIVEAKERVLASIAQGAKVAEAVALVNRSPATYEDWRKHDAVFARQLAEIRESRRDVRLDGRPEVPPFDVFCDEFLHEPLFRHQYNAWDALEGREPRFLDPAITYEPGDKGRLILNFPPAHGKTVTFSMNYLVWRIHKNPGISIAIVSKSQGFAKKILGGIKARLTDRAYRDMHVKFAPDGGWRDPDASWTQNMIYVTGKYDGETEKEPTVEALGMGGQIYGGRFDIIVMDDVVDNENAHRFEDQSDWAMTILDSRLPPAGGLLMVLGTRLASTDLYSTLRSKEDENEQQFFTYLSQPAVLEYAEKREDWRTLWPWCLGSEHEEDAEKRCRLCYSPPVPKGKKCCPFMDVRWLRPRWNGQRLAKKRYPLGQRRWSLVWQQQQIPDDATFNEKTVTTSINRLRQPGVMRAGAVGHRPNGMEGMYVVGGLDPATIGYTAMIVGAVDRVTGKRWILDGFNQAGCSPRTMREKVKELTDKHGINEWVIERNAFQKFLTDDPELLQFFQSRGVKRTAHNTGMEKRDPDFGVMSMPPLFESTGEPQRNGGGFYRRVLNGDLIELPDDRQSQVFSTLVSQLIAWEPSGPVQRVKTDLVMALYFCEIAFKKIVSRNREAPHHLENRFASRERLRDRQVINLSDWRAAAQAEKEVA